MNKIRGGGKTLKNTKMKIKAGNRKESLVIDFLFKGDRFPQEEGINALRALPIPRKFEAGFYCAQKEQYLDVTRAIIRLLVADGKNGVVSSKDYYLRKFTAMARQDFQAADDIMTKLYGDDDFMGEDYFQSEGMRYLEISATLSTQTPDDLVSFYSQPAVFELLEWPNAYMVLSFRKASPSRGELYVGFCPGCDEDGSWTAQNEYNYLPSGRQEVIFRKELKRRKMEKWQKFLKIGNYHNAKTAADRRLFEYAAAITEKIIERKADHQYGLVLDETITRDNRECFLFSPTEFQANLDRLMWKYC